MAYTEQMLAKLDRARNATRSRSQALRQSGIARIAALVNEHGPAVCDEMLEAIKRRDGIRNSKVRDA